MCLLTYNSSPFMHPLQLTPRFLHTLVVEGSRTFQNAMQTRKGFGVQAIVAVKFLYEGVGLVNNTMDVILVNRRNQSDKFQTVLPAKTCVRVLLILMLTAAAVLVMGVLAVLLVLACAGTAAGVTWVVDDDGGADFTSMQTAEAAA